MAYRQASVAHSGHHVVPQKTYLNVFYILIGLTVLTVAVVFVDLGAMNIIVALAIALVKAVLVVMFFMGLKYDSGVNTLVLTVGVLMLLVFIVFTVLDTEFRGSFEATRGIPIADQLRAQEELQLRHEQVEQELRGLMPAVPADTLEEPPVDTP